MKLSFVEKKTPTELRTPLAIKATETFWKNFHLGKHEKIPDVLEILTAAYYENPYDATTASHLGFTHAWAISESARSKHRIARVIEHPILATKYFREAHELDPNDPRLLGFLGDFLMVEGSIDHNERKKAQGYFLTQEAIQEWPEWGLFTLSFPLSQHPYLSARFQESIELMWKNLDVCLQTKVDRQNPTMEPYKQSFITITQSPKKNRACANTWIAPHNIEGFFWHFGDILTKNNQPELAVIMYKNAKILSPNYESYPYKNIVEDRIKNVKQNMKEFQKELNPATAQNDEAPRIMVQSGYGCVGCHQNSTYVSPHQSPLKVADHIFKQFSSMKIK